MMRWLVTKKSERRQITQEIKGLRANSPGGPVTSPFVIPSQFGVFETVTRRLQNWDVWKMEWVDIDVPEVIEENG